MTSSSDGSYDTLVRGRWSEGGAYRLTDAPTSGYWASHPWAAPFFAQERERRDAVGSVDRRISHLVYVVDAEIYDQIGSNTSLDLALFRDIASRSIYTSMFDAFDILFVLKASTDTSTQYHSAIANPSAWGSSGRLRSLVFFSSPWSILWGASLHEIGHLYMNLVVPTYGVEPTIYAYDRATRTYATTPSPTIVATGFRGQDKGNSTTEDFGHWGLSDANGQMGGFAKSDLTVTSGTYRVTRGWGYNNNGGNARPYATIELWHMGLVPDSAMEETDAEVTFYTDIRNVSQTLQPGKMRDANGRWIQDTDARGNPRWDENGDAIWKTDPTKQEPTGDLIFTATPVTYDTRKLLEAFTTAKVPRPVTGAASDLSGLAIVLVRKGDTGENAAVTERGAWIDAPTNDQVMLALLAMSHEVEPRDAYPLVGFPVRDRKDNWTSWSDGMEGFGRIAATGEGFSMASGTPTSTCDWLEFSQGRQLCFRERLRGRADYADLARVLTFQRATGGRGRLRLAGHSAGVTFAHALGNYRAPYDAVGRLRELAPGARAEVLGGGRRFSDPPAMYAFLTANLTPELPPPDAQ